MKKNKTSLFIVLGLIFIIGFSMLISNLTGKEEVTLEQISYTDYAEFFGEKKKGLVFVYYGSPNCGWCERIKPLLAKLETEEGVKFKYLIAETLTLENANDMLKTTSVFGEGETDPQKMGTPALVAIVNGKEHSNVGGYREIEDLREFVKAAKSAIKDE